MDVLLSLERALWTAELRFDRDKMEHLFASDLAEFGRSGKTYDRSQLLPDGTEPGNLSAQLHALRVRKLSDQIALVTYVSEVDQEHGKEWSNRSSIWDNSSGDWKLRFHQGTPTEALT